MRLVFAGSPAAAVPSLLDLAASEHEIVRVVTRSDTPQGRKRTLTATPVAVAAERLGLDVLKTRRLTDEAMASIAESRPDLGVIVAYGALLREPLLSVPRLGWINLHFSLLPRWRGAAPVQHALIAGDQQTGAAVFQLVPELDAGKVYATTVRRLSGDETAGRLLDELAGEGAELLVDVVRQLAAGTATATEQSGPITIAPKLGLGDARLDFEHPVEVVFNRFRGVTPEPGAHVSVGGVRLKVLDGRPAEPGSAEPGSAAPRFAALEAGRIVLDGRRVLVGTGSTPFELRTVQPSGKKAMSAADWLRGVGTRDTLRVDSPSEVSESALGAEA